MTIRSEPSIYRTEQLSGNITRWKDILKLVRWLPITKSYSEHGTIRCMLLINKPVEKSEMDRRTYADAFSPAAVWPVAADGKVFITDPERAMTAIDLETGETIWRTKRSMVRETIGLSEDQKRIYSKTMNDSIVCYSTKVTAPHQYGQPMSASDTSMPFYAGWERQSCFRKHQKRKESCLGWMLIQVTYCGNTKLGIHWSIHWFPQQKSGPIHSFRGEIGLLEWQEKYNK